MIFADQHQYVVDIDFDLFDEFHLKNNVIIDVVFLHFFLLAEFMVEIKINTLIILEIPF